MKGRFSDYLRLPREIADYERSYLDRTNRFGLAFFWCHLPVFVAVGYFNETGPLWAMVLTMATLVGPTIALWTFSNPRAISVIYGFTAMCMGGLLVHFGQGPVQIEMHFYFFTLIAMLVIYANPMVIEVAAITVTLHHAILWVVLPSSVFNYDASIWVVGVHAAFVTLESVAACYIARSFFDDVLGLERIVDARTEELDERNRHLQLVLGNVGQGFLILDRAGCLTGEQSAVMRQWFGSRLQSTFAEYVGQTDKPFGEWFELGWEALNDAVLPLEVNMGQLPTRLRTGSLTLDFSYTPIGVDGDDFEALLVVITDVSNQLAKEAAQAERREVMHLFEGFLADKRGFLEFVTEADELVGNIACQNYEDVSGCKRWLHTLKGNALLFGVASVAEHAHDLESVIDDENRDLSEWEADALYDHWAKIRGTVDKLVGERHSAGIELTLAEYQSFVAAVDRVRDGTLTHIVNAWRLEPVQQRLVRIAAQAAGIAERLGKPDVRFEIQGTDLRLASARFRAFWQAFVHVIRNAVDHGVETEMERLSSGKDPESLVVLAAGIDAGELCISIEDDGRGIDWHKIAARASSAGLAADSAEALVDALFQDGITTAAAVSEVSGRGVGMGTVREAVRAMGGRIAVHSELGQGTLIQFRFPVSTLESDLWYGEQVACAAK